MSQENVELIRRGVEAFNRGGFEAADGVFWSEDIVWDVTPARIPGRVCRGREEVRKMEFSQVATLRDGKLVQVDVCLDREKALEAAVLGRDRTT